jgi:hypothetical protein
MQYLPALKENSQYSLKLVAKGEPVEPNALVEGEPEQQQ